MSQGRSLVSRLVMSGHVPGSVEFGHTQMRRGWNCMTDVFSEV